MDVDQFFSYGPRAPFEDAVDQDTLNMLLPLMLLRRLIGTPSLGLAETDGVWIRRWLHEHRPDLLTLAQ